MWKTLLVTLSLIDAILGAAIGDHLEAPSFEFLSKYTQKQYRTVVSLKISNASVNKVDPKLKYLKNLQYLDLSYNNVQISSIPSLTNLKSLKLSGNSLKSINMSALPQNIEELDISNNLLAQIPKDWRSLRSLKTLHLYKNPIDCECINVLNYDRLIKAGILIPEPVKCHSPNKYLGKNIDGVNCSLDDIMLYDEPVEGSGDADIFEDSPSDDRMRVPVLDEDEEVDNNTIVDDRIPEADLLEVDSNSISTTSEPIGDEGSGDEGSGLEFQLPESGVLGCYENCSTPGPIGAHDEAYASTLPGIIDQMKILIDDLNFAKYFQETTSTISTARTTPPSLPVESSTLEPVTEEPVVKHPKVYKESEISNVRQSDKNDDVEVIANGTQTEELERASAVPQNSTAVYAVVGVLTLMAVLFLICFIKKRNSSRKNSNRRNNISNGLGEELKPLSKPPIHAINEKPVKKTQNVPEHIPLINGKNGTPKSDSPVLTSFTPLPHPEKMEESAGEDEMKDPEAKLQNGSTLPDEVEFRPKYQPELLTPQRERVTIRESEIPESIPKTPLLVHRQKNSDGEIVTTVVP